MLLRLHLLNSSQHVMANIATMERLAEEAASVFDPYKVGHSVSTPPRPGSRKSMRLLLLSVTAVSQQMMLLSYSLDRPQCYRA
jgi:hypothetical protein